MDFIDYKRADILSQFVQERGKILPRRMTGVCSRHQRWLGVAIKRARNIALLPFAGSAAGTQAPRAVVRPPRLKRRLHGLTFSTSRHSEPACDRQANPQSRDFFFTCEKNLLREKFRKRIRRLDMQIILQEDVEKLGHRGDVVTVKPGYARNFLLPKKLAVEATPGNMKALERIRGALAKKTATELDAAKKQAELLTAFR